MKTKKIKTGNVPKKMTVYIDEVPIEVIGTYISETEGCCPDEILPSAFEIESYKIEPRQEEYLLAWHSRESLEEMIAEKCLEETENDILNDIYYENY